MLPRQQGLTNAYLAIMGLAAAGELLRGPIFRPSSSERGLFALIAAAAGLLVLDVFADDYLVMNRRMQPVDYQLSYIGGPAPGGAGAVSSARWWSGPGSCTWSFAPMTEPLEPRVIGGISAPGRGSTPSSSFPPAALGAPLGLERQPGRGQLALLPMIACFNGCGQRPLAAALLPAGRRRVARA